MENLLKSRKFYAAVVGLVGVVVNELTGKPLDEQAVLAFVGVIASYILGTAWEDSGKAPRVINAVVEDDQA